MASLLVIKRKKAYWNELKEWSYAVVAFLGMYPYFLWEPNASYFWINVYRILQVAIILFFLGGILIRKVHFYKKYCIYILIFCIYSVYIYYGSETVGSLIGILIKLVIMISLVFLDRDSQKNILVKFTIIFSVSMLPSIGIQFLKVLDIYPSFQIIYPLEGPKAVPGFYYKQYFGAIEGGSELMTRICGMFDEPGVVGTMSGLLLATNVKKNNWIRVILFISGILSLSFAFFIIYGIYKSLSIIKERSVKRIFFIVLLIILLVFILSLLPHDNLIYRYTIGRIGFSNGKFLANNRTTLLFDIEYNRFLHSTSLLWGMKKNIYLSALHGISSYKQIIYQYGIIIFALFTYLIIKCYYFVPLKYRKNLLNAPRIFLCVFLLSMYQRPNVINCTYMVVLLGGLACSYTDEQIRKKHCKE